MSDIIKRIIRDHRCPELFNILSHELSPSDLQSLLLEVYRARAGKISPAALLKAYRENRFVSPSQVDPRIINRFDALAYSLLPEGFTPVELSPVAPLGTCSALATCDQNKTLSTIRNTEVIADPTNALSLECSKRRLLEIKDNPRSAREVKLCSSIRTLRAQPFSGAASFSHFRLLSLCTAGKEAGKLFFECDALYEHLNFYCRLIQHIPGIPEAVEKVKIRISLFDHEASSEDLEAQVLDQLRMDFDRFGFDLDYSRTAGLNYYQKICFSIDFEDRKLGSINIVDGGFTDWTAKLTSSSRERLLISAIGTERICQLYMK